MKFRFFSLIYWFLAKFVKCLFVCNLTGIFAIPFKILFNIVASFVNWDILSSLLVCLDDWGRKIKPVCLVILGTKSLRRIEFHYLWKSILVYLKKDMISEWHLNYSPLMVILWMGLAVSIVVFGIPNEQTPLQGSGKLIEWSFCLTDLLGLIILGFVQIFSLPSNFGQFTS